MTVKRRDNESKITIVKNLIAKFSKDQSGTTAIEYGIIAALLSLSIVASAASLGGGMEARFQQVSNFIASGG